MPRIKDGSDDPSNLTVVCANCHEDLHGGPYGGQMDGVVAAHTPEAKAKRSASFRRLWEDPEYRARQKASREAAWARDPGRRRRQSERVKQWFIDHPEENEVRKARISESKRTVNI